MTCGTAPWCNLRATKEQLRLDDNTGSLLSLDGVSIPHRQEAPANLESLLTMEEPANRILVNNAIESNPVQGTRGRMAEGSICTD